MVKLLLIIYPPIEFPTRVSPLVTNGVVISGYIISPGKPYTANSFGLPIDGPLAQIGIVMALKIQGKFYGPLM